MNREHAIGRAIDTESAELNVIAFMRCGIDDTLVCVANLSPVPRTDYRLALPHAGRWLEVLNSDAAVYGGSGKGNLGAVEALSEPHRGLAASVVLTLPPLAVVYLVPG